MEERQVISRKTAKLLGLKRYFTGKPCIRGHLDERQTVNATCFSCSKTSESHKNSAVKWYSNPVNLEFKRKQKRKKRATIPDIVREKDRIYYANNSKSSQMRSKKWKDANRQVLAEYERKKRQSDFQWYLGRRLRDRLRSAIRIRSKSGAAIHDLGCSIQFLIHYLELQFSSSMSWANYGTVWHIDHKIPLRSVDLTDREQLLSVVHYTNLQPLLVVDHVAKTRVDVAAMAAKRRNKAKDVDAASCMADIPVDAIVKAVRAGLGPQEIVACPNPSRT
jgi:hypothetical protein